MYQGVRFLKDIVQRDVVIVEDSNIITKFTLSEIPLYYEEHTRVCLRITTIFNANPKIHEWYMLN